MEDQSNDKREALMAKWKDKPTADLLNAKVESDLYIETLTARFDDLKKDFLDLKDQSQKLSDQQQASADLQALLDQARKELVERDTSKKPKKETTPTAITDEAIEQLIQKRVSETLTERQKAQKQDDNYNLMQSKLKEKYGDNHADLYKQRLEQLGLSKDFADNLAKDHPSVFMKTFELEAAPLRNPFQNPSLSTQRSTTVAPVQKRDWNYYQDLKKTNPKLYLDPKIAIQMHDDAIAMGDAFGLPQE